MAVKPLKPLKRHSKPLEDWQIEYLTTGNVPKKTSLEVWEMCFCNYGADAWQKHKKWILKDFISQNPGKRPWAWWEYDAPRWQRKFGTWYDGTLAEPRKRLTGTGDPNYEYLAYVPSFSFGIPVSYVNKFSEEYYNGRRRDVNGELIPCKYKEGDFKGVAIDLNDPPLYESQASYLKRHGLLLKSEEKRLKNKDFEPESCLKYIKTYD